MSKATAIQWLFKKLATSTSDEMAGNINNWFKEAESMERIQIEEAFDFGDYNVDYPDGTWGQMYGSPQEYYIKNYGEQNLMKEEQSGPEVLQPETKMNKRKYRMYGLVNYQLSGIQKGIQFGHAVQEYNNLIEHYREVDPYICKAFDVWRKEDKTFIILDGGTTNSNPPSFGTLNRSLVDLTDAGVLCASFREPDLGDQLTAFVFLVDDRVFDRVAWPDYDGLRYSSTGEPVESHYYEWKTKFSDSESEADRIIWLRDYLKNFKLA